MTVNGTEGKSTAHGTQQKFGAPNPTHITTTTTYIHDPVSRGGFDFYATYTWRNYNGSINTSSGEKDREEEERDSEKGKKGKFDCTRKERRNLKCEGTMMIPFLFAKLS